MKKIIRLLSLVLVLSSCGYGDSRDYLILLDSVPINDSLNAYWFCVRGGIPAGRSGGYLSIARSSKEISRETACYKEVTGYYTTGMVDGVLVVEDCYGAEMERLEGNLHGIKVEIRTCSSYPFRRPELNIRPYDD